MKARVATAAVDGTVVAEAVEWEEVEGNVYFPPESLRQQYFTHTDYHTSCPWKGQADYFNISVGDTSLENAAWFYPTPKDAAENIKGHVAFYKTKVDIKVQETEI